jgi:hypothetical protein
VNRCCITAERGLRFQYGRGAAEFNDRDGTVVATFTTPVENVTISAKPVQDPNSYPDAEIFLEAYNAAGGRLASALYPLKGAFTASIAPLHQPPT